MAENDAAPIVEVSRLRKTFGTTVAVADVSFTIEPGRSLAIVGESGSGKSTVARILAGLETATAGTVRVCGRDRIRTVRGARERRRRGRELQIVFQDPYSSLDPRQRVGDCVAEVMRLHQGLSKQECVRQTLELGELVGLDERDMRA
jgi:ABC-type glutathione transport system ATPase component